VDHLLETGANDVLVVRGERERLIPWIMERTIRRVDPEQGRIVVDWDPDF
jgi:16S rRNA processing protein RimM